MFKNIIILTIMILFSLTALSTAKESDAKDIVHVSKTPDGYTLFINASNITPADILKDLEEKCNVKIITKGKPLPSTPVSMRCSDISLKEAIKKLMKVAGVKNHLVNHKTLNNKQEAIELRILKSSDKPAINITQTPVRQKTIKTKKPSTVDKQDTPSADFNEKVERFKENYQWENEETMDLAGHLLEAMPDQIKQPGMEELVKSLDEKISDENINSVNEETLIQAIEGTVPPKIAPVMSKHMKQYIQQFKGEGDAQPGKTSSEAYQEFFTNKNKH